MVNIAKKVALYERRQKAVEMRLSGMKWADIGKALGYSGGASAYSAVKAVLLERVKDLAVPVEELRELELMRLDALQAAAWEKASQGEVKSIEAILKIMDRRSRYLGLDAPKRHEVITIDVLDAQIRELDAQIAEYADAGTEETEAPRAEGEAGGAGEEGARPAPEMEE